MSCANGVHSINECFYCRSNGAHVRRVLKQSLLATSVKGIPRALRAERILLKCVWAISAATLITAAIYQSALIIINYIKFDYITYISDASMETGANNLNPALTVCNLNNFEGNTSDIIKERGMTPLRDYVELVEELTKCPSCSEEDAILLRSLRRDLLTPHGYYTYLGRENASLLSQDKGEFIVDCFMHKTNLYRSHLIKCKAIDMSIHWDSDYYVCRTIKVPRDHITADGVTLILHLDNFFEEQYDHLDVTFERGKFVGAILALHEEGKFPNLRFDSVFLRPGHFSHINILATKRESLPWPYSNCSNQQYTPNTHWLYTADHCFSSCVEMRILTACSCRDIYMLDILNTEKYRDVDFCMDPSKGRHVLLEKTRCAKQIRDENTEACRALCPASCSSIWFEPVISCAMWPPDPFHEKFYKRHIAGRSFEWRYRDLLEQISNGLRTESILSLQNIRDVVNKNFLRLDISLYEFSVTKTVDMPKTSFASFLSELGGVLNIFVGISFVVGVELFDVIISLFILKRSVQSLELQTSSAVTPRL